MKQSINSPFSSNAASPFKLLRRIEQFLCFRLVAAAGDSTGVSTREPIQFLAVSP
jgi:hypothetical protein